MRPRTRYHVLFWTDFIALVNLAALAVTGLIIEYVLPPGSGGGWVERGGQGIGREETVRTLLGYTRHQWGYLHYILALVFLALMLLHILLHANWIKCYFRRSPRAEASCETEVVGDGREGSA